MGFLMGWERVDPCEAAAAWGDSRRLFGCVYQQVIGRIPRGLSWAEPVGSQHNSKLTGYKRLSKFFKPVWVTTLYDEGQGQSGARGGTRGQEET